MTKHYSYAPRYWAAFVLASFLATPLLAGDVSWSMVSATFSDGGTVTGTFIYNPDTGSMRTWNLSTSGGNTVTFPAFTYTPANSSFSFLGGALIFQGPFNSALNPFPNGFRELRIGPFSSPLDDTGGNRDLPADNFGNLECYNWLPARTVT